MIVHRATAEGICVLRTSRDAFSPTGLSLIKNSPLESMTEIDSMTMSASTPESRVGGAESNQPAREKGADIVMESISLIDQPAYVS